jgi:hypothetical protein
MCDGVHLFDAFQRIQEMDHCLPMVNALQRPFKYLRGIAGGENRFSPWLHSARSMFSPLIALVALFPLGDCAAFSPPSPNEDCHQAVQSPSGNKALNHWRKNNSAPFQGANISRKWRKRRFTETVDSSPAIAPKSSKALRTK